jgi:hypothetical protein
MTCLAPAVDVLMEPVTTSRPLVGELANRLLDVSSSRERFVVSPAPL